MEFGASGYSAIFDFLVRVKHIDSPLPPKDVSCFSTLSQEAFPFSLKTYFQIMPQHTHTSV